MIQTNEKIFEKPETLRVKKTHSFTCFNPIRIILSLLEKAGLRIYEAEKNLPVDSQKAREENQP